MFTDKNLKITTEEKNLETAVGNDEYKKHYVEEAVNNWNMKLKLL